MGWRLKVKLRSSLTSEYGPRGWANKQSISLPVGDKVFLFENISGCFLLLYERGVDVYGNFYSFLKNGLEKKELCVLAYDSHGGKLHPEHVFGEHISKGMFYPFPFVKKNTKELKMFNEELCAAYREIPKNYHALRLVADFNYLPKHIVDKALVYIREMVRKKNEKICLPGSNRKIHFPLRSMIALEVETLNYDKTKELFGLFENIVISARNEYQMSFLNFRQRRANLIQAETVSRETLEHFVKSHLETIILALLLQNPLCGYYVIQSIYQRYSTFLSQGTVYPILYSLQRGGLLEVSKPVGSRAKIYSLTEKGIELAHRRIEDFKRCESFLLESMSFKK